MVVALAICHRQSKGRRQRASDQKSASGVRERRVRRAGKPWTWRRHLPARNPLIRSRGAFRHPANAADAVLATHRPSFGALPLIRGEAFDEARA